MMLLLGTLCARFRDLPQIVATFMQVVFFATPIMFLPEQIPANLRSILELNPFAALLAVAREPLIGHMPSSQDYALVIGMVLLGWTVTVPFYGRYRQRIPYWL
jgi:lipopolysaccharide transport system permease protein